MFGREDVMKIVPNATEDQLTAIMIAYNKGLQEEQKKTESARNSNAEETRLLQEQLEEERRKREEVESKGLSDAEKIQKQNSALLKQIEESKNASAKEIAELKAQLALSEIGAYAASKNLAGEHIANILKAFNGDVEAAKTAIDSIVGLKGEWESAAALAKEQEIANASLNPGGQGGTGDDGKGLASKLALRVAQTSKAVNQDALNKYRR